MKSNKYKSQILWLRIALLIYTLSPASINHASELDQKYGQNTKESKYPNGQVSIIYFYNDQDKLRGYRIFDPHGTLTQESTFSEDGIRCVHTLYYPNGKIQLTKSQANGKNDGPNITYHENGSVWTSANFLDNRNNGERKEYNAAGKLILLENYKDDKLHGEFKEYFDDGSLSREGYYENNVIKYEKAYDQEGNITYEERYD